MRGEAIRGRAATSSRWSQRRTPDPPSGGSLAGRTPAVALLAGLLPQLLLGTLLDAGCGPVGGSGPRDDARPATDRGTPGWQDSAAGWRDGSAPPWYDGWLPPSDSGVCEDVIDLVFVLDVSSSMGFVLDELERGIGEVVSAANALAADSHFGLMAFVDNFALDTSGDLEGGVVHSQAASLQAAFAYHRATYTRPDRNPGDGPGGPTLQNPICEENALDALHAVATGFPWREHATRVIIVATDDTFLERPDNYGDRDGDGDTTSTDFPREGNYPALRTIGETVAALRDARVRVFGFTRRTPPGFFDRCSTGRRLPWTSIKNGWSAPYGGAPPIPEATQGSNFDLDQVRSGTLSLRATINQVVVQSYCNPPVS